MADRTLRGMRLGGPSLQSEEGVVFAERQRVQFQCAHCGHRTEMVFSAEAELPEQWDCRGCGMQAGRVGANAEVAHVTEPSHTGRTPWEMLLERRTIPELEELLEERLSWLRSRRGQTS